MEDIPLNMQVTNSKSRNIYFDILKGNSNNFSCIWTCFANIQL